MNLDVDLIPLWLTLKVAGVATLAELSGGGDSGLPGGPEPVLGPGGRGRSATLPLVLPPTVLGYYLIVVIGRHGWLGHWLQETWGFP